MTVSLRLETPGRAASPGRIDCSGRLVRQVREDFAPALFRLLSDSVMSRAALAACGAAVAIVDARDAHWPIAYLNPAFERLFGHRDIEAHGRPLLSLILAHAEGVQDQLLEAVRAPHEVRAIHSNGTALDLEILMGPVHDSAGHLTHWVLTFADQSQLARLREELAAAKSRRVA